MKSRFLPWGAMHDDNADDCPYKQIKIMQVRFRWLLLLFFIMCILSAILYLALLVLPGEVDRRMLVLLGIVITGLFVLMYVLYPDLAGHQRKRRMGK